MALLVGTEKPTVPGPAIIRQIVAVSTPGERAGPPTTGQLWPRGTG